MFKPSQNDVEDDCSRATGAEKFVPFSRDHKYTLSALYHTYKLIILLSAISYIVSPINNKCQPTGRCTSGVFLDDSCHPSSRVRYTCIYIFILLFTSCRWPRPNIITRYNNIIIRRVLRWPSLGGVCVHGHGTPAVAAAAAAVGVGPKVIRVRTLYLSTFSRGIRRRHYLALPPRVSGVSGV